MYATEVLLSVIVLCINSKKKHLLATLEVPYAESEGRAGRREQAVQRYGAELEAVLSAIHRPERRRQALVRHASVQRQAELQVRRARARRTRLELERVPVRVVARRRCRRCASAAPSNRGSLRRTRTHAAAQLCAVLEERSVVLL